MKKIILLFLFINISVISFSQTDRATFLGVSMNLKADEFLTKLLNKGFIYDSELKTGRFAFHSLKGKFLNFDNCSITIRYGTNSKYIIQVKVIIPNYSMNKSEIHKFINDLDNSFDCRIIRHENEDHNNYIWFAKDKSFTINLECKCNEYNNECIIIYHSEKSTENIRKLVCKEPITNNYEF